MIAVAGTIRVAPGNMDALRPHARAVIEATRAEAGCVLYSFAEDLAEPGLIRIYEEWRSWGDLETHGKAAHMTAWRVALKDIGVISREVKAFEMGEAKTL
jgi:quinol monooxygenase YgiN